MNPDKLFDYLDDRLPEAERRALEEQLMNNAEARREFEVARRIRSATHGQRENLEVLDEPALDQVPGKRMARQILLAASVLVGMNVLLGLLYIAHHEWKNPNRALLEKQNREQLRQALDKAAADTLMPPPLGVTGLNVTTQSGRSRAVADEVVQLATRLDGTATKGVPDEEHLEVLVEMRACRLGEFRDAVRNLDGVKEVGVNGSIGNGKNPEEKISIVVQVTEAK